MHLVTLSDGGVSLEFSDDEFGRLKKELGRTAPYTVREEAVCDILQFAGFEIVFQNEWDSPVLIAGPDGGADLLRAAYEACENRGGRTLAAA